MSDDSFKDWPESFDEIDAALKNFRNFKKRQSRFADDLVKSMAELTYQHFTAKSSYRHLDIQGELEKGELRRAISTDNDFKFYGMWIFEEVAQDVIDFVAFSVPAGRRLSYIKPKYPSFTEEALELSMREFESECRVLSDEERADLRQILKEDAQIQEFYTNFRISIHKALKELVLEYFPEIGETSSAGLREIDSLLNTYMCMIRGNIMSILADDVRVSVYEKA